MANYNYLPGVIVNTVDNGLASSFTPSAQSTLIIGTSGQGPVNQPTQVVNPAVTAALFGFDGDLVRSMEEVLTYSDNVILFRMGTSPQILENVGARADSAQAVLTEVTLTGTQAQFVANNTYQAGDSVTLAITGTDAALSGTYTIVSANANGFVVANTTAAAAQAAVNGTASAVAGQAGFAVTFGQNSATAATDYQVWYNNGIIAFWYKNNIVFSNSEVFGAVDTGDISLSVADISSFGGLQLGSGVSPSLSGALTVQASTGLAGSGSLAAPTLVNAITGLGLTGRQSFVAFRKATELLSGIQVDQIFVPTATIDAPNVAFYVSSDANTVVNNPVTNPNSLDWLKVTSDPNAYELIYQWAGDTKDSEGNTVSTMNAVTPTARLAAGFHEVNWGYEVASFAASVSGLNSTCMGIIGTSAPASFKLTDVRKWIGSLPTFAADGITPATFGRGLLGNPYLVGTTATKLNNLCADFITGVRLPGFYQNEVNTYGEYDGGSDLDLNQNPVDIGAYLHVVADQAIMTNSFATNYITNIAGVVAGYLSALDQKSALTNKALRVTQLPGLIYTPGQLDALTQANINVLRNAYKNSGTSLPVLLHDKSAASVNSDYTLVLRTRIKGLVVKALLSRANSYIGESSLDGLTIQAMQTALDKDLVNLQTRGYISRATVTISATQSQQKIGHASLFLKFNPANELVQLTAYVGIVQ